MNSPFKITVIGQGYVGLPLSLSFAMHGARVIGVDSNEAIAADLKCGRTTQTEKVGNKTITEILREESARGSYRVTTDGAAAIRESNAVILTVGLPIDPTSGDPIYTAFEGATRTIGENIQAGTVVLVRSTVVPGTTETFCLPLIEKLSGLKAGKDFFIAYVPERIAEGKAFDEFVTMPTLIGAPDEKTASLAEQIIRINSTAEIIHSDSIIAVETAKVLENLQRDANIAIVQEFARFAENAGMDTFEVIRLANTHRRVNLLSPGPGVGGYCIPNAFHYLNAKAREIQVSLPLLQKAREMNESLPAFFVDKTVELLNEAGRGIHGAKIAVIGLAMKDQSPDDRLSPSVYICEEALRRGAVVAAYDPNVAASYPYKVQTLKEACQDADALLILNTIDTGFDPLAEVEALKKSAVILDTRGAANAERLPKTIRYWKI